MGHRTFAAHLQLSREEYARDEDPEGEPRGHGAIRPSPLHGKPPSPEMLDKIPWIDETPRGYKPGTAPVLDASPRTASKLAGGSDDV